MRKQDAHKLFWPKSLSKEKCINITPMIIPVNRRDAWESNFKNLNNNVLKCLQPPIESGPMVGFASCNTTCLSMWVNFCGQTILIKITEFSWIISWYWNIAFWLFFGYKLILAALAMGKSKNLSLDYRKKVLDCHNTGNGYKKISKSLKMPLSTVKSIVKKWKTTGKVKDVLDDRLKCHSKLDPEVDSDGVDSSRKSVNFGVSRWKKIESEKIMSRVVNSLSRSRVEMRWPILTMIV